MHVLSLCVYSFVICFSLRVFLELILLSLGLGATLGVLLGPVRAPWAPKGLSLASLCFLLAHLGCRWAPLDHLGLPSGACDGFGSKWTSVSMIILSVCDACEQKVTSWNSRAAAPAAANAFKVAQESQLPTPLHSHRGPR